VVSRKINRLG